MTEWRKIPGLPSRYEASDDGQIRILPYETVFIRKNGRREVRHLPGRLLEQFIREDGKSRGHPVVAISAPTATGTKSGAMRVNLLVARAFHGTPYPPGDKGSQKWRVKNLDGDITNVRADNLEWVGTSGTADFAERNDLYNRNMEKLEQMRREPVENWIKRIWGDDYAKQPEEAA